MKKIISAMLVCAMLVLALASCGSGFNYQSADLSKYLTLGAYDGIPVEAKDIAEITDDDVQKVVDKLLDANKEEKLITDVAIASGNTIRYTYEGHLYNDDGSVSEEKFNGGTITEPTNLKIGSNSMIPGFEDGLIGVVPGETSADAPFELNVTFPAEYSNNPALQNKRAVFYCVIDGIFDMTVETGHVTEDDIISVSYTKTYTDDHTDAGSRDTHDADMMSDGEFTDAIKEKIYAAELKGEALTMDPFTVTETVKDESGNETNREVEWVITINFIKRQDFVQPELTDEFVAEKTDFETVEEYKADIRQNLEDERAENLEKNKINAVWQTIVDNATVKKLPSKAYKNARKDMENNLYAMYNYYNFNVYSFYYYYLGSYYWADFDAFLKDYYSTYDDYNDGIRADAENSVKEMLVFYSIVKAEKYENAITADEYNKRLTAYAQEIVDAAEEDESTVEEYIKENYADYYNAGATTPEKVIVEIYGGEKTVREAMLWDYVMEQLTAKATITLK